MILHASTPSGHRTLVHIKKKKKKKKTVFFIYFALLGILILCNESQHTWGMVRFMKRQTYMSSSAVSELHCSIFGRRYCSCNVVLKAYPESKSKMCIVLLTNTNQNPVILSLCLNVPN